MAKYSLSQITSLMKTRKQEQLINISEISDICYENNNEVDSATCQGGMQNVRVIFSNKKSSLLLVLKVCAEGSPLALINESLHIFDKEISFYSDIVPYICKFENSFFSKNLFQDLFVNFYGAGHIENDVVIILERLSDDYIVFPRDDFLRSKEEIQRVLKSLAVFHASSYAIKCKGQVNFREKFPILKEYLFDFNSNDVFFKLTDQLYRNNIKLLKAVVEDSKYKNALFNYGLLINFDHSIISRLENLSSKIVLILQNVQLGNDESNLLCHGDFHMWNIAFSKSSEKVKFFDFQLIRYAPCMTDFHQYLSQVSSPSFRQSHLPDLMHMKVFFLKSISLPHLGALFLVFCLI